MCIVHDSTQGMIGCKWRWCHWITWICRWHATQARKLEYSWMNRTQISECSNHTENIKWRSLPENDKFLALDELHQEKTIVMDQRMKRSQSNKQLDTQFFFSSINMVCFCEEVQQSEEEHSKTVNAWSVKQLSGESKCGYFLSELVNVLACFSYYTISATTTDYSSSLNMCIRCSSAMPRAILTKSTTSSMCTSVLALELRGSVSIFWKCRSLCSLCHSR